jgi:membrane protein DedA with SNARE-associated domain
MFLFFSHLIGGAVGSTMFLSLAVILSAFFLEDAATVVVGVLAADGIISVPVALLSLYLGSMTADVVLYTIGWIACTHPRLAHYVDHEFTAPLRAWLESRYSLIIFSGHFVPGLRFTAYVASGFFRFPFLKYISRALPSGLILSTTLFTISYLFGNFSSTWVGEVRWGVAALFILCIFFIARHNILMYRAKKDSLVAERTDADTHTPSA